VNNNCTYNDSIGDLLTSGAGYAAATAAAVSAGGLNIAADVAAVVAQVQFAVDLWHQWTSHPAADAKDFIKNAKPNIVNIDPYERIVKVIGYSQKINPKAIDVNTREWLKWYKQNYKDDYLKLSPDVKIYWNNYLNSIKNTYGNVNKIFEDLDAAAFTITEINTNANSIETVTNLVSNITSNPNFKYVLYGGIGLIFVYLLSSKK
jgi:spore coat protein CotH